MARPRLVLGFALALLLAGCINNPAPAGNTTAPPGGSTPPPPSSPAVNNTVELVVSTSGAYPVNPGFDPVSLTVASRVPVHLVFTNAEQLPLIDHNWVLEGVEGAATDAIAPGASAELRFTAPAPGEYAYFCSVGDHRARGMVGTLTVA